MPKLKQSKFHTVLPEIGKAPAGFKPVRSTTFSPKWDYIKHKELIGIVLDIRQHLDLSEDEPRLAHIMEVVDGDGSPWTVWESKSLEGLFKEVYIGDRIRIVFNGTIPMPGKKADMKDFSAWIAPGTKRTPPKLRTLEELMAATPRTKHKRRRMKRKGKGKVRRGKA